MSVHRLLARRKARPVPTGPPPATFEFTVMPGGNDARFKPNKNTSYDAVVGALGRNCGGRIKFFSNGNIAEAVANRTVDTSHSTEPYPIYCFKTFTTAEINAFLNTLNHRCSWTYWHEFYSTVQSEWDDYNAKWAALKALRDAHANGYLVELQAMSAMSDYRSEYGPTYTGPGGFIKANPANFDSWGADTYNAKGPTPYTAEQLFTGQAAAWEQMKLINPALKWRIGEYGLSRLVQGGGALWTGPERVAWIDGHITYAKGLGLSSLGFWAVDNSDLSPIKDWSIDKGTAADVYTAAYMATMLTTYPVIVP